MTTNDPDPHTQAVIWVANVNGWPALAGRCADYVSRMGYELVAAVIEGNGGTWRDVERIILTDRRAEVVVTPARDHLPPDRTPRVEAVADERHRLDLTVPPAGATPPPNQRHRRRSVTPTRPAFLR